MIKSLLEKNCGVVIIKSFVALEDAMAPYKDQVRDLRASYSENDWLSKEDMRMAVKVYRMLKQGDDLEMISKIDSL